MGEKIIYFDEKGNVTSQELAVRSVIKVYDDKGVLIQEIHEGLKKPWEHDTTDNVNASPSPEIQAILDKYKDSDGNYSFGRKN